MNADGEMPTSRTRYAGAVARLAVVLVAFAAAVALTSAAAGSSAAAKQRMMIETKDVPEGTFVLTPLQAGAVESDSGTVSILSASFQPRTVIRDGQSVDVYEPVVWTLKEKQGTLTIREPRNEWVSTGGPAIGTGSWKVVSGTGAYAGITGSGRSAHAGLRGGTDAGSCVRRAVSSRRSSYSSTAGLCAGCGESVPRA